MQRESSGRLKSQRSTPSIGWTLPSSPCYALENAVVAAADLEGVSWKRSHDSKVEISEVLRDRLGLPDVADLLRDLNELRKSESYGEVKPPQSGSAEDIVTEVEEYVLEVEARLPA